MIKFPMKFTVESSAGSGIQEKWSCKAGDLPPIPTAIPLEFKGPGGGYSPEEFFALAILNCIMAIFKVYCEKAGIGFREIKGKVELTVDNMASENFIAVTHVDVYLDVIDASDPEKARKIMDSSVKDCIISNSIKSGKTFHITIH